MFTAKVGQMDYRSGLKQVKKYDMQDREKEVQKDKEVEKVSLRNGQILFVISFRFVVNS